MKKLLFILTVWLALGNCNKDHDAKPTDDGRILDISGKILDAQTLAPISSLIVIVQEPIFSNVDWTWHYNTIATSISDENGAIKLHFTMQKPISEQLPTLKIMSIPDDYQQGARVNGVNCSIACDADGSGGYRNLENKGFYTIEIFPRTKAYFVKPAIPEGWENDTLQMTVTGLVEIPGSAGWVCSAAGSQARFNFRLNNQSAWTNLKQARHVSLGDSLTIDYSIRNGGVKKSGSFGEKCQLGKVNTVELHLW